MAKVSGDESEPRENDKLNNSGNGDNGNTTARLPAEIPSNKMPTRTQMMQERWDSAKTFISENYYRVILVLVALVLFLFLTVIVLSVVLGTQGVISFPMKCESAQCLKAAASVINNIDASYDRCDDFWSYSCGNWIKSNKIPPEKGVYTVKDAIKRETNLKLLNLIYTVSDRDLGHGIDKIRKFYTVCMDSDRVEHYSRRIKDDYLQGIFGGWHPMDKPRLDWEKLMEYLHKDFGVTPFFRISIEINDYDPTAPGIKILPSGLGLPSREHYWNTKYEKIQRAYKKYIEDLSHQIGVTPSEARRAAETIFEYERKLSEGLSNSWNVTELLQQVKIRDLRSLLPSFKWLDFIQSYAELNDRPFREHTEVLLSDKNYFKSLSNILSTTTNDVLNTYLIWQFLNQYVPYFGEDYRTIYLKFQQTLTGTEFLNEKGERWEFCIETTKKFYDLGLTSLLLEKEDVGFKLGAVEHIIEIVKAKMKDSLESFPWIVDHESRVRLAEKIDAVNIKIGYPSGLPDAAAMEKYYLNAIYDSSLIKFVAHGHSFKRKKIFQAFLKNSQNFGVDNWPILPFDPEISYQYAGNTLYVGFGLFNSPIYEHDNPSVMNYGSLAFHISSELLKAISFKGLFYDRAGRYLPDYLEITNDVFAAHNASTTCLANKLLHHNSPLVQQVNIDFVLSQTVADINGLQIAFQAYERLVAMEGQEHPLPGVSLYNDQLFFVAFAQSLCESVREGYAYNFFQTMTTLPGKLRVDTIRKNIPQFSKSFTCRSQEPSYSCPKFA